MKMYTNRVECRLSIENLKSNKRNTNQT